MPRPTGPCARCIRHTLPGCEHLGNTWDRYVLKTRGTLAIDEPEEWEEITQELVEYALNRMLALDRDNGNKAEGLKASRIYRSRNLTVSDAMEKKCAVTRGPMRCMRNAGHDGVHKF